MLTHRALWTHGREGSAESLLVTHKANRRPFGCDSEMPSAFTLVELLKEIILNSGVGAVSETGGVNSVKTELSAPPDEYAECVVRVTVSGVVICERRLSVMAQ